MINQIVHGSWLLEFHWIDINDEKFILPGFDERRHLEQTALKHFSEAAGNTESIIEFIRIEWRRMRPGIPQTVSLKVSITKSPDSIGNSEPKSTGQTVSV